MSGTANPHGGPNPFGGHGTPRRRTIGITPSKPLDESQLKTVLDNWAVEQTTRFGGGMAQNIAAGRRFAFESMEADPQLTAPGAGLRAQLMTSAEEAIKHGSGIAAAIPATATTPAVPAQPLHELAERWKAQPGGMGAPAPFDYQHVMQAMQPHMGSLSAIQGLHRMGLERTASTYTGVEERMSDVRGAQAAHLQAAVQQGRNVVDPGRLSAQGGPAPGTIDVGDFQDSMASRTGGPSTLRTMGIMERILDTLQSSLGVENVMAGTLKDAHGVLSGGGGGGGRGGGGGLPSMGAGSSGLAGAISGVGSGFLRNVLPKIAEEVPEVGTALVALKGMQLAGQTRAREYEPIRQLELMPGMSQQGDLNQIAQGQSTGIFGAPGTTQRWSGQATLPFFHMMGGQTENDLRYGLQYASTAAGLGREAGQQVAMGLGQYGVGFRETHPGEAAADVLQTARIAMGPGRAAGLSTEESTEVTGLMRGKAGMSWDDTIRKFQELTDVSERLGVGTKNLSQAYKQMLEAGFDPSKISVSSLGVAQAFLGAGTNVGGYMQGVAQMTGPQQIAQSVLGGFGPGVGLAGGIASWNAQQDPTTNMQGMVKFGQSIGPVDPRLWTTIMNQAYFGGQDVLGPGGMAGMNLTQTEKLEQKITSGHGQASLKQIQSLLPADLDKRLGDPTKYLKDSTEQLGQGSDAFQKGVDNFTTAVNQFAATGGDITSVLKGLAATNSDVQGWQLAGGTATSFIPGGGAGGGAPERHTGTMPRPHQTRPPGQHTPAPSYMGDIPDPEPLSAAQAARPEVTSHDRPATSYVSTPPLITTQLPTMGADPASAFQSPAMRAAVMEVVTLAIHQATGGRGLSAAPPSSGAGTGPAAQPALSAATGTDTGSSGVLQGGLSFHAFSGAGPAGGLSVSSGKASQGSSTVSPQLLSVYEKAAAASGVPLAMLLTQTAHESGFDPTAQSSDGGYGLAQFTDSGVARKYLGVQSGADWHHAAMGQQYIGGQWQVTQAGEQRVAGAQASFMSDLYKQSGGNWQQALDMYNAGPGAKPTTGDYGSQILSAAANLDLTLSGTLTVVDQSGHKVGTAQITRQGHHAKVNARPAAGHRTSGQAATRSGPTPS